MHILERINLYTQETKKNPYIYSLQKLGIELFKEYITSSGLDVEESYLSQETLSKLIVYWIPKNKRYLSETQAYQVIYTIHDIYNYVVTHRTCDAKANNMIDTEAIQSSNTKESLKNKEVETPTLLELYGEEYMRLYKVRNKLFSLTKDPVIAVDPLVVDLNRYRQKKNKGGYQEIATTYEQAIFKVIECKEGGQVTLAKPKQNKEYRLLLEYPIYKDLKPGDLIHAVIKRKLFYVYWELEEIKSYYLPEAIAFL